MDEYCILCGRYIEITSEQDVFTLRPLSEGEKGFVCNSCIKNKLNSGEPIGGCLYCDNEEDYLLQRNVVRSTHADPSIGLIDRGKPMVCETHFQELTEENQDHTLSIEDVLDDDEQLNHPSIALPDVIGQEENQRLEYKETFQYNPYTEKQDKSLKANTVKEVAAFGNTDGGVVIIGVDDSKKVQGLERDYSSIGGHRDEFELQLVDVIRSRIDQTFASQYIEIEFHEVEEKDVCAIHVEPNPNPMTVNDDKFYIRQGSSSKALTKDQAFDYLSDRWDI